MKDHTKTSHGRAKVQHDLERMRAHRRRHRRRHGRRHHAHVLPIHPDRLRGVVDHIDDREILEVLQRDLEQALLDVAARIEKLES